VPRNCAGSPQTNASTCDRSSRASDAAVTEGYAELEPFVARNLQATNSLFPEGIDPDPVAVADEITRVLALPYGTRPFRTVVDFTRFSVDDINELSTSHIRRAMHHMGYERLLTVAQS
jgi:hypothetical protein